MRRDKHAVGNRKSSKSRTPKKPQTPPTPRKRGRPPEPTSRRSRRAALMNNPMLMTYDQVAAEIGVHAKTLYRMVVKGEFPEPARIGHRTVRFKRAEVEAYVEMLGRKTGKRK
jgi:excisionase family DNA binding protein